MLPQILRVIQTYAENLRSNLNLQDNSQHLNRKYPISEILEQIITDLLLLRQITFQKNDNLEYFADRLRLIKEGMQLM